MTVQPDFTTALAREAYEAPSAAERQINRHRRAFSDLGRRLRAQPPRFVVTCARGSSDHAASYGKYLIEAFLGKAVASVGPSVASLYDTCLDLRDALFIVVSQSGRSPDLLRAVERAREGGALVVGFVNDETSPLPALCDVCLPLSAGPEVSVAATKSYILSGLAFLSLVAHWSQSEDLLDAVEALPTALEAARDLDWRPVFDSLVLARSLFVIGRGYGLGAAQEMALKFKETCRIHGEAFSAAEVFHGPLALVGPELPVLALGQGDPSAATTRQAVARIVGLGGIVWSVLDVEGAGRLPGVPDVPAVLAPLCELQSFYMSLPHLIAARGLPVDAPAHLNKVTETL
ncbi:MAG: SIS domain-containing protein [Telmatospirillum sp.]|nr:SIS domain-containing protein [Telmatospirillum sp.]